MLVKIIFVACIQALFFQDVFSQCIGPSLFPRESIYPGSLPCASLAPIAPLYGRVVGGNLVVDTSAPYAPTGPAGVTIFSDNLLIEGAVLVSGKLPFQGTVGLEGVVPATGSSAVSYACGSGNIGIVNEGAIAEAVLPTGVIGQPAYTLGCGRL